MNCWSPRGQTRMDHSPEGKSHEGDGREGSTFKDQRTVEFCASVAEKVLEYGRRPDNLRAPTQAPQCLVTPWISFN